MAIDFEAEGALRKYIQTTRNRIRTSEIAQSSRLTRPFNAMFGTLERYVMDPANLAVLGDKSQAERLIGDQRTTAEERKILERLLKATEDGVKEQKETNRRLSEGGLIGVAE